MWDIQRLRGHILLLLLVLLAIDVVRYILHRWIVHVASSVERAIAIRIVR